MRPSQAFILCAGEGTRLRPYTDDRPKCMVDIAGKPCLLRIFEWLEGHGVHDFIVNLSYKAEAVFRLPGADELLNRRVLWSVESDPLGTYQGIRRAASALAETFYLVYGDTLTNFDLGRLNGENVIVSADVPAEVAADKGQLKTVGAVVLDVHEKPPSFVSSCVFGGIGRFESRFFKDGWIKDIGAQLLPKLAGHALWHVPLKQPHEWLIDIGTEAGLLEARRKFA